MSSQKLTYGVGGGGEGGEGQGDEGDEEFHFAGGIGVILVGGK